MIVSRPRCPVCGTRLNQGSLDREVELGNESDMIEQDIGGRGRIDNLGSRDFDEEEAKVLLEKVEAAREYLREILGIEDED